ncbi:phosphatase PAP2 family protein [bacterium]|nr:phosphatase PAP2 family protein [bacterium]
MDWSKGKTGWFLLFFTVLIVLSALFNQQIFGLINGHSSSVIDTVMFYITQLGDGYTATLLCLWLALRFPRAGIAGMMALLVGMILVQPLKSLFDMPRPASVFDHVHIVGQILRHKSFPSGHSASVMSVAIVFTAVSKPLLRWIILVAAFLTGLSRIYIGVHFPVDVAVGLSLGWAAVMISLMVMDFTGLVGAKLESNVSRTILASLLLVGGIGCLFWYNVEGDLFFYRSIGLVFSLIALVHLVSIRRAAQFSRT